MYKNVIFDLGGVVLDFNPRDFLLDYFMNKTAEDEVYDLTFGSKEWEELDAGLITRAAANRAMLENAAQVGRTFEVQTVIDEWEKILHTKRSTVKTMMQLKLAGVPAVLPVQHRFRYHGTRAAAGVFSAV